MLPIGLLMTEHRLIERMISLISMEIDKTVRSSVNADFIDVSVDFIRMYADRCHHGKEENILFRDLMKKNLKAEHKKILNELFKEHEQARGVVKNLVECKKKYIAGDEASILDIISHMKWLVNFYPAHIEKEDKHFFVPCMDYFSGDEKEAMLLEFEDFDRNLIHEKYRKIVESLESVHLQFVK